MISGTSVILDLLVQETCRMQPIYFHGGGGRCFTKISLFLTFDEKTIIAVDGPWICVHIKSEKNSL